MRDVAEKIGTGGQTAGMQMDLEKGQLVLQRDDSRGGGPIGGHHQSRQRSQCPFPPAIERGRPVASARSEPVEGEPGARLARPNVALTARLVSETSTERKRST